MKASFAGWIVVRAGFLPFSSFLELPRVYPRVSDIRSTEQEGDDNSKEYRLCHGITYFRHSNCSYKRFIGPLYASMGDAFAETTGARQGLEEKGDEKGHRDRQEDSLIFELPKLGP
jgi:hypothetical protein